MQDLLLYSQIPLSRHKQLLQILAGITASQPAAILEQHLIFEQLKLPVVSKKAQSNTDQRRTYQHLVRRQGANAAWQHRTADVPEPGVKQVISQSVKETSLSDSDLEAFRPASTSYKFISQYYVVGSRFVNGNVVVSVSRICRSSDPTDDPILGPLPELASLSPLDQSGSYIVEAYVRVEDGSTTALRDRAAKELLSFADSTKGAIDLRVPDRLALDPRLRT